MTENEKEFIYLMRGLPEEQIQMVVRFMRDLIAEAPQEKEVLL